MAIKIATWNVNSIRQRMESLRRFVEAEAPDLLCLQEVKARGGKIIAVAYDTDTEIRKFADLVLTIPQTDDLLAPVNAAVPLQLLAYHVAKLRGHDIDQPRNLAKSVTVE